MQVHQNENIVVSIDIGTTKVCVLVTKKNEDGRTEVLGLGKAKSLGVMRGEVANIDKTVQAIKQAVEQAEKQSGVKITDVYVGIAGQHIKSMQHRGILTRENPDEEITGADVKQLIRDMHKLALHPGERIIHVLPQEFFVDGACANNEPIGMCGSRLEANFHIITGRVSAAKNIERCIEKAGLNMVDLILEPLASSASVLDNDEKTEGVALVDIGGGTTDLAIFQEGIIRHTCVIPFGGNIITEDIRQGCRIMKVQAEELKVRYGTAVALQAKENQVVSIPGLKGRSPREISMRMLGNIIQARIEEIFQHVYLEIKASNYFDKLNAGIVVTGGGSQLKHIKQLVEFSTGLDARIGFPIEQLAKGYDSVLQHPMFATGIGLAERAYNDLEYEEKIAASNNNFIENIEKNTFNDESEMSFEENTNMEDDIIKQSKKQDVKNWWKDIFKGIPEWLMDETDEDFEE